MHANFPPLESRHSNPRSSFSHYLPRLRREFYQGDAVIFWTMPVHLRKQGWLSEGFHAVFREMMLHAADREGLLCPAYCLMPDHIHFVWMGIRCAADQRNGMKFVRAQISPLLRPSEFQHQAYDHVLKPKERQRKMFSLACADYILLNPFKRELVSRPSDWPYLGAIVPGYPHLNPFSPDYWPWFWKHYFALRETALEPRVLPPREME